MLRITGAKPLVLRVRDACTGPDPGQAAAATNGDCDATFLVAMGHAVQEALWRCTRAYPGTVAAERGAWID